jgi:hypothetical protein
VDMSEEVYIEASHELWQEQHGGGGQDGGGL